MKPKKRNEDFERIKIYQEKEEPETYLICNS